MKARYRKAAAGSQYAIIVGLIAIAIIIALTATGGRVNTLMGRTANLLCNAAGGNCSAGGGGGGGGSPPPVDPGTPNAFSFTDQTGVAVSATITSNAVTLAGGFPGPVTATCGSGCTGISRNGAGFVAGPVPGFVSGDTIAITQTSSSSYTAATTATVTIASTTSASWSATTFGTPYYGWGYNANAAIGDGTLTNRLNYAPANLPAGTVSSIAVGTYNGCALSGGKAYCWGSNPYGSVGDGTINPAYTPTLVSSGGGYTGTNMNQITVGYGIVCGIISGNTVVCWGTNGQGQVGDSTTTERRSPVAVTTGALYTGSNMTMISAGYQHVCGVTSGGRVLCWGDNQNYQQGDGTTTNRTSPNAVSLVTGFTATNGSKVSAGTWSTCSLTTGGKAFCWAQNAYGETGNGTSGVNVTTPAPVSAGGGYDGSTNMIQIFAGDNITCGVISGNKAICWGYNVYGQIGDGTFLNRLTPVAVSAGGSLTVSNAAYVTTSIGTSCALLTNGKVSCWGQSQYGQLGNGGTTTSNVPVDVTGLTGVTSLAGGAYGYTSLVLK